MPNPPQAAPGTGAAPTDLAWRVIGLVNLYRLLVATGFVLAALSPRVAEALGLASPARVLAVAGGWFVAGVALVLWQRLPTPPLRRLALAHGVVDALATGALLWAAGGIDSGFGVLVLLPIGAMALLAEDVDALFMAAVAAVAILFQQAITHLRGGAESGEYLLAGLLGLVVFLTALLVRPLAKRLRESEAVVKRQQVDLANLAQLSQYIVQHLRESILVVDGEDRIRLINESAAAMLGEAAAWPGALLGEASPRLLYQLSTWRQRAQGAAVPNDPIPAADGARLVQPHFAALGGEEGGPVLVFLEDTSLLAGRVQQSKLAALGRLSASIAHEIRNPVGAMSHAAQLLAEAPGLAGPDQRLTQIIRGNADRVSRIIENVLEFSRRGTSRPARIDLAGWLATFRDEFAATLELPPAVLALQAADDAAGLEVRADPAQLQQVVWNLCQNAIAHAGAGPNAPVELRYGRLATNGRPFLEVADRGPGISNEDAERIFEPFFTSSARGTGLGLFLARELAQSNGATLLQEARAGGGSVFRLVFSDPGRWEMQPIA